MKNIKYLLFTFLAFMLTQANAQEWESLFNGKNLEGWVKKGGKATYEVVDGVIVSTATKDTINTFLCTEKEYEDFILELEVYANSILNSGVMFRALSTPEYKNGRVHGYQMEIDPLPRAWSGGIYDEARRGWLYPLSRNKQAQSKLHLGQWNKIRIEAIGNTLNTWVNGVHCARLVDAFTAKGFFGLQVHGTFPGFGNEGDEVKWKNIKILTKDLEKYQMMKDPSVVEISFLKNELTQWEKEHGFHLLWDGKTPTGWKGAKLDEFPTSGWEIKDGELTALGTAEGEDRYIVTTKLYSDFELELEFKITEGANSGIKYFVDPTLNQAEESAIGCEFQVLDDKKHPDAKRGTMGNRTIGSLYDLITAKNLSVEGRKKQFRGIDEWNKARIVSKNGKVEHWLNNEKVVEYDRFSQMFEALVSYSIYQKWKSFGRLPEGTILLQGQEGRVSYRSIKIRVL